MIYVPTGNCLKNQGKISAFPKSDHMAVPIEGISNFIFLLTRYIRRMAMLVFPVLQKASCRPARNNLPILLVYEKNTCTCRVDNLASDYPSHFQKKPVILPVFARTPRSGKIEDALTL